MTTRVIDSRQEEKFRIVSMVKWFITFTKYYNPELFNGLIQHHELRAIRGNELKINEQN